MAELQRFNRQVLAELRERSRTDLFFFQRAIWGDKDLTEFHRDLCDTLQGPWTRLLVCAFRGSLKSSSGRAWIAWRGLFGPAAGRPLEWVRQYVERRGLKIEVKPGVAIPDWSCLLVEQRYENAEAHHEYMQGKFMWGPQAALLQDMFRDRIPDGFTGWNKGRTILNRSDPNAEPTLVIAGLDSRLESLHKDAIVGDDLEGADADLSDVPNEQSLRFVLERAVPLLREPETGQILVVGTPHGDKPLVHELRDLGWQAWWKEIIDPSTGEPRWPERYSKKWFQGMQADAARNPKSRRVLDRQYLLRRETEAGRLFDMNVIDSYAFDLEHSFRIRYRADTWNPMSVGGDGMLVPVPPKGKDASFLPEWRHTDLSELRCFMHLDPKHRDPNDHKPGVRPSMAAIIVTGVSPDLHIFTLDTWIKDAGLDEFTEQFFFLYRKWAPYRFTADTVGAQIWLKSFLRILETTKYQHCMSLPRLWRPPRRLPRPSSLLVEAHKSNRKKEEYIIQQLEVPCNLGFFHLNRAHVELRAQLEAFPSSSVPADGPDALAQGPMVWDKFLSPKEALRLRRRQELIRQYRTVEPITGYVRGFPSGEELAFGPN